MRATTLVVATTTCALLVGCSGPGRDAGPADSARPVIGVSLLTLTNPFFRDLGNAIKEEGERRGYQVVLTAGDYEIGKQKNQVSDFIVRDVAAIVVTPIDSKAIATSIAEANKAGIPVFTADIKALAEGVRVICHVATDNYQAGRVAGKALVEALGGRGKVGVIDHPEVESVIMRTRGFLDELEEQHAKSGATIDVVARLPAGGAKDRGFQVAQDMLQAHPDLNGFFAINDPSALGAVAAVENAGKSDQITIVSIDGLPEGREAIRSGKIYADAIQHSDVIGRKTVEAIDNYLSGEEVPAEVLIPTDLYRREDALKDPTLK
jgi:ribose transport system substrate-binding protein